MEQTSVSPYCQTIISNIFYLFMYSAICLNWHRFYLEFNLCLSRIISFLHCHLSCHFYFFLFLYSWITHSERLSNILISQMYRCEKQDGLSLTRYQSFIMRYPVLLYFVYYFMPYNQPFQLTRLEMSTVQGRWRHQSARVKLLVRL